MFQRGFCLSYRPFKKVDLVKLKALVEQGLKSHEIAAEFQCSGSAISQNLARHGLVANDRPNYKRTKWNVERANVKAMLDAGKTKAEIAVHYQVSYSTISGVLFRLALADGHEPVARTLPNKRASPQDCGRWTEQALTETWEARKARRAMEKAASAEALGQSAG